MKKFFKTKAKWWNSPKRVMSSAAGGKLYKEEHLSMSKKTSGVNSSAIEPSPTWQHPAMDSGGQTVCRRRKRKRNLLKHHVADVSDVNLINEVLGDLFGKETKDNSLENSSANFCKNFTENKNILFDNTLKIHEDSCLMEESKNNIDCLLPIPVVNNTEVKNSEEFGGIVGLKTCIEEVSMTSNPISDKVTKNWNKSSLKEDKVVSITTELLKLVVSNVIAASRHCKNCKTQQIESKISINLENILKIFKKFVTKPPMSGKNSKMERIAKTLESLVMLIKEEVASDETSSTKPNMSGKKPEPKKVQDKGRKGDKEVERLVNLCSGVSQPRKSICLVELQVKSRLSSFKDIKNVLIHVFNVKPNDFGGITKNNADGMASFLIMGDSLKKYMLSNPHPEAGKIVPWSLDQLFSNKLLAHSICAQVHQVKNVNISIKKGAKDLQNYLMGDASYDYLDFLWGGDLTPK